MKKMFSVICISMTLLVYNFCASGNSLLPFEKTIGSIKGDEKVSKRVGSLIKVRPEYEERYIILHKHTFPGVLSQIRKCNIRNYSIFLLDGILFSHFEYVGKDFENDMKVIADETTREWWKLTDPMQEPIETRKEGEWWAEMELLMCFDKLLKPSREAVRVGLVAEILPAKEDALREFFKNYPRDLEPDINKANIQNSNFYLKDNKIYFYYEYAGEDLENDIRALISRNEIFTETQKELEKLLVPTNSGGWKVMREVFHTD